VIVQGINLGKEIDQLRFDAKDYRQFRQRLNRNLKALAALLKRPGFGVGPASFGAELELYIIDDKAGPRAINGRIHEAMNDSQLTLELNQFNLEYNFAPIRDLSRPFSTMEARMESALSRINALAHSMQASVLPIGILPTLKTSDLGSEAITDQPRYHVLAKALRDKRGEDFHIHIEGLDTLDLHWSDVSLEGANTSFQFHYRVNPDDFADAYNAAQLMTPLVLALAANSPLFMGKRLWQETRIALFQQSIDTRLDDSLAKQLPARVLFGLGWIRDDIFEMFAEAVYLFEPLMPICSNEDPEATVASGKIPALSELRLHQGSIWSWNRPIYDPADGGHLRIELRALPAGPSVKNMVANAALSSGLICGLQDRIKKLLPGLPFRYAEQNFYRAAKHGLNARLFWPSIRSGTLEERPVVQILQELLPLAEDGLNRLGLCDDEIDQQLAVVRGGLDSRINGATWQLGMLDILRRQGNPQDALAELVKRYARHVNSGLPVHEWSLKD